MNIYLIAGEASGDQLGAHLMGAIRRIKKTVRFMGIGGLQMREKGLRSLFPIEDISVMGLLEVLPHIFTIRRRINQTVADIMAKKPDCLVTIDAPGFCHRVIKKIKAKGFTGKIIHYVAPTVWAWKPARAKKLAQLVDQLMVLLPFEPPYFEIHGLPTTFVGHPVVRMGWDKGRAENFRNKYKIRHNQRIVLLLPGSRKGEIRRHLPVFLNVSEHLRKKHPDLVFVIPTLKNLRSLIGGFLPKSKNYIIFDGDKRDLYKAASLALVCSGTASLELACAGVTQIVGYKMSFLTYRIVKRLVKVKYASLVNLLLDKPVIPEYIQHHFTPSALIGEANEFLQNPDRGKTQCKTSEKALKHLKIKEKFSGERSARCVLSSQTHTS